MRAATPLLYVIQEFPTLTQTFVTSEIRALREQGAEVLVYPLRPGDPRGVRDGLDDVVIPPPARAADLLADMASWSPRLRTAPALLRAVAGRPGGPRQVIRAFYAFAHALRLAQRVDERLGEAAVHCHAHFAARTAEVCRLLAAVRGDTYSVTAHALDIYAPESRRALARRLRAATFVACTATYGRRHVLERGFVREPGRVVAIPMGIDLGRFAVRPAPPATGAPLVLAVGRLIEKKGFQHLIEAAAALRLQGRHLRLVIAGGGPLGPSLRSLAGRLGCADTVEFAGALDHAAVAALYREAAVLVLPCVIAADGDRDGLPTVLLEAMASGTPVVSTTVSGVPELVRDGENGVLVPPGDAPALAAALAGLLDDPTRRRRLAHAARRTVETERDLHRQAAALLATMRRFGVFDPPASVPGRAHSHEVNAYS